MKTGELNSSELTVRISMIQINPLTLVLLNCPESVVLESSVELSQACKCKNQDFWPGLFVLILITDDKTKTVISKHQLKRLVNLDLDFDLSKPGSSRTRVKMSTYNLKGIYDLFFYAFPNKTR